MLSPSEISVVLVSYARPWNLPKICQSLVDYGFEDIHMVDNWQPSWESDGTPCRTDRSMLHTQFDSDLLNRINFIKAGSNCRTASRYLAMDREVKNEVIATVDDDYVVTPQGWDQIIGAWTGEKIVAQLPSDTGQFGQASRMPFINIGYGSLFKKSWSNAVFSYLLNEGLITQKEFHTFADRIFTTFFGAWDAVESNEDTLIKLLNPDGTSSDVDSSSIHLKEDYWLNQWQMVMKAMGARAVARAMYMKASPLFSEYQSRMGFLSHTAYGG